MFLDIFVSPGFVKGINKIENKNKEIINCNIDIIDKVDNKYKLKFSGNKNFKNIKWFVNDKNIIDNNSEFVQTFSSGNYFIKAIGEYETFDCTSNFIITNIANSKNTKNIFNR